MSVASFSSTDAAIIKADKDRSIRFVERQGRFNLYVAICDDPGTIEVHDNLGEAFDRVRSLRKRAA